MTDSIPRRLAVLSKTTGAKLCALSILALTTALIAHAKAPDLCDDNWRNHQTRSRRSGAPRIEAVFVLDTTGSMSNLIEGAKQKIWSIANRMAECEHYTPDIRMGLIGYRDRGDAYVTRRFALDDDIDALYGQLQSFQAGRRRRRAGVGEPGPARGGDPDGLERRPRRLPGDLSGGRRTSAHGVRATTFATRDPSSSRRTGGSS